MSVPAPTPTSSGPKTVSPPQDALRQDRSLLVIACLFSVVGGYLDAYAYLAHGHVFANAQTGNIVFLGVYASDAEWVQAARHVPPIVTFVLGVAVAWLLGAQMQKREFRAMLLCQGLEIFVLCGLALFGNVLPDPWVVPVVSFVSALQTTSFQKISSWSFTTTMTTGNLRKATTGLVLWLLNRDAARNRDEAIALGWVCLSFLAGAACGGVCTRWSTRHALLPCVALVAAGFLLTWRERRRRKRLQTAI